VNINPSDRSMIIKEKGTDNCFDFDQINSIKLSLAPTLYRGGRRVWMAWELYNYAVIKIENDKQFIITCLIINDLRKFFKDKVIEMKIIEEKDYFPLIDN